MSGCRRCGGEKLPGQGQRLCATCRDRALAEGSTREKGKGTPCKRCGKREGKQPRKQFCDSCKTKQKRIVTTKRRKQRGQHRKPCNRCGGPKEKGPRRRYCDRCTAIRELEADNPEPRECCICLKDKVTRKYAYACDDCRKLNKGDRDKMRRKARRMKPKPRRCECCGKLNVRRHRARLCDTCKVLTRAEREEIVRKRQEKRFERVLFETMEPYVREWLKYNGHSVDLLAEEAGVSSRLIERKLHGDDDMLEYESADAILLAMGITIVNIYEERDIVKGRKG